MTHTPLTDQQLNELETLAKNLPAGPWTVDDSRAELRGSHGNLLADLWDDRLGAYFATVHAAMPSLAAEVRRLRAELIREECLHSDTIDDRDRAQDAADKLAYAVAPANVIGEHTADNSPWANALDLITSKADVDKLHADLAEEKASHNPRLRCLLIKPHRDKDMYVGWSNSCEMPAGVWSRETAIEYGFPPSRLDRADETGTSSHIGDGGWDDWGFIAEQRGTLRRDRLGDYAIEYLHGDREAAYALLEPFEGETEVRRSGGA